MKHAASSPRFIAARPYNFPYDGRFDPSSTAVLVIDMQVSFLASDGYFAHKGYDPTPLRAVIPAISAVIEAARASGCRVIWTRQGFRPDLADLTPYERWRCGRAGIRFTGSIEDVLVRAGPGHEIIQELIPKSDETVVDKTANNAFYQTDLDMILRTQDIRHLIFTGCTTDVCVHSTLREASDRKYQCLLVEDACASVDPTAHEAAVRMVMVEDGIFGVVATTVAVVAGMAQARMYSTPN